MRRRRYIYERYEVIVQTEDNLTWEATIFIKGTMTERITFDGEPTIELVLLKYALKCSSHLEALSKVVEI